MSFKETEVGMIPDEWIVVTVENLVASNILKKPLDGNHGSIHPTAKDYVESGIPFVMATDIKNGEIDYDNCKFISCELSRTLKKGFSVSGDVLLTHKATIGRTAIVKSLNFEYIVLTPQVTYYRIKNTQVIFNEYLKYYFDSSGFQKVLSQWAGGGSTRDYLGITGQLKLPIVLPHISEQKSIAHILSTLDEKIEVNNQINKILEAIAQTLFQHWFIDFEFPNENGEPYKSSGGEMVESELGLIPKGWEVKEISTICNVKDGTHDSPKNVAVGYPLVTSKHLVGTRLDLNSPNKISHADYENVNKRSKVDSKDILISMIGTVGNIHFVLKEEIAFAIKNIGLFKTSEVPDYADYIYFHLKSNRIKQYISDRLAGSTQQYISLGELRKIPILMYSDNNSLFAIFKKLVSPIMNKIAVNECEIESLTLVRDTLLPKLMSGEIRVPIQEN